MKAVALFVLGNQIAAGAAVLNAAMASRVWLAIALAPLWRF
jgi:hypothetical protein